MPSSPQPSARPASSPAKSAGVRVMPGICPGPKLVSTVTPNTSGGRSQAAAADMASRHMRSPPWVWMVSSSAPLRAAALTACATVFGMS